MHLKIRLFEIKDGKRERLQQWGDALTGARRPAALETLRDEHAQFEALYAVELNDKQYAVGIMISGEEMRPMDDRELNQEHARILRECLLHLPACETIYELSLDPESDPQ